METNNKKEECEICNPQESTNEVKGYTHPSFNGVFTEMSITENGVTKQILPKVESTDEVNWEEQLEMLIPSDVDLMARFGTESLLCSRQAIINLIKQTLLDQRNQIRSEVLQKLSEAKDTEIDNDECFTEVVADIEKNKGLSIAEQIVSNLYK